MPRKTSQDFDKNGDTIYQKPDTSYHKVIVAVVIIIVVCAGIYVAGLLSGIEEVPTRWGVLK